MNIEQLRYICMIDQTNSITVAAERLFVTQQTISKSIHRLETELGVLLLKRSNKGVTLTEQGQAFVSQAGEIVAAFLALEQSMQRTERSVPAGTVQVYETSYTSHTIGTSLQSDFYRLYPEVKICIHEMLALDIVQKVVQSQREIGVIPLINDCCGHKNIQDYQGELEWEIIYAENLMAYVSAQHPLAEKATVSFKELVKYPLVWGDCPGFEALLRENYHLQPQILISSSSSALHDQAVAESMAVGFTSDFLSKEKQRDPQTFTLLNIREKPKLQTVLIKARGYQLDALQSLFIAKTKEAFLKL